jgi:hypothetical protein
MIKKSVLLTALAIAGFAVTTSAQTVPNYVPTNGLVGWWPFNGNAIDESINTNDGTVNGATLTADRFGNANSAYSFQNQNITISNFNFNSNQLSLSFWIKANNFSTTQRIVTHNWPQGSFSTHFDSYLGNPLRLGAVVRNPINTMANTDYNTPIQVGQWYNVVLTNDLTNQQLFVNGVLVNTVSSLGVGTHNGVLYFGGDSFKYNGKLDDIGIWNRALTPNEITGLYNANLCFQTITVTDTLLINTNLTGFNPVTYQNTIKIWPNPTNDHITIDNGNLANLTGHQIKISNALGQQVFQSAITQQQFYVDMSTWGGNGIYFVNLINAQGVTIETRKIVLQ